MCWEPEWGLNNCYGLSIPALPFSTPLFLGSRSKGLCKVPQFLLKTTSYVLFCVWSFLSHIESQWLKTRIGNKDWKHGKCWQNWVCLRGDWQCLPLWIKFVVCALICKWVLLPVFGGKVWGNFKYPQERRRLYHLGGHLVLFTKWFSFVLFRGKQTRLPTGSSPRETHDAGQKHTFCSSSTEAQFSHCECQSDHWGLNWINMKNKVWNSRQLFLRHLRVSGDDIIVYAFLHGCW